MTVYSGNKPGIYTADTATSWSLNHQSDDYFRHVVEDLRSKQEKQELRTKLAEQDSVQLMELRRFLELSEPDVLDRFEKYMKVRQVMRDALKDAEK